ncbi:MAG: PEP-utilizing protein mobile region [Deltaproteobacteria bacterium]|nr:PEP-utilizing protein mobile region [Deltaproteobacteria bacterium]
MQSLTVFHQSVSPYIPWGVLTRREDPAPLKRKGFAASPGIVEGPCTIVRNPEDLHSLHDGAILVCDAPSPVLAPYMRFLRGLVAGLGGPHCIAAGYAREQEVPAVVGVGNLMEAIHAGDVIRIDGSSGTVEIVG